jgi:hypothetical protein
LGIFRNKLFKNTEVEQLENLWKDSYVYTKILNLPEQKYEVSSAAN